MEFKLMIAGTDMKIVFINLVLLLTILISFCDYCFSEVESLSDDQLGELIATEGVCNIKVVDGCNASPELKLVINSKKIETAPLSTIPENQANHNVVLSPDNWKPSHHSGSSYIQPPKEITIPYTLPNNNYPEY